MENESRKMDRRKCVGSNMRLFHWRLKPGLFLTLARIKTCWFYLRLELRWIDGNTRDYIADHVDSSSCIRHGWGSCIAWIKLECWRNCCSDNSVTFSTCTRTIITKTRIRLLLLCNTGIISKIMPRQKISTVHLLWIVKILYHEQ